MAQYKDRKNVTQSESSVFDTRHAPGTTPNNPGIYRCPACGDEIPVPKGAALPAATHHEHGRGEGRIEWQLLVFAEQRK